MSRVYDALYQARQDGITKPTSLKLMLMDEFGLSNDIAWRTVQKWIDECVSNPLDVWYNEAISNYIHYLREKCEDL